MAVPIVGSDDDDESGAGSATVEGALDGRTPIFSLAMVMSRASSPRVKLFWMNPDSDIVTSSSMMLNLELISSLVDLMKTALKVPGEPEAGTTASALLGLFRACNIFARMASGESKGELPPVTLGEVGALTEMDASRLLLLADEEVAMGVDSSCDGCGACGNCSPSRSIMPSLMSLCLMSAITRRLAVAELVQGGGMIGGLRTMDAVGRGSIDSQAGCAEACRRGSADGSRKYAH